MKVAEDKRNAAIVSSCTTAILAIAITTTWYFATPNTLMLIVGLVCSLALGIALYLALSYRNHTVSSSLDALEVLLKLSGDEDVSSFHRRISRFLLNASKRHDTIFRELLVQRLQSISDEVKALGDGRIEFGSTESWRIFYEQILRSPGTHLYRSVSHIETQGYWQDGAGRKSTELNLELHDSGAVSVERIAIIADHLWRPDELFPVGGIHEWLVEQHRHGIWISLVRESELEKEKGLISDFGIYGNRAVGRQIVDSGGRTTRFILSFDYNDVENADSIWKKLNVFSVSYSDLLDHQH